MVLGLLLPCAAALLVRAPQAAPPAGPDGYSFELVPAPNLFPEPRNLTHGNTTLRLGPVDCCACLSAFCLQCYLFHP